MLVVLDDHWPVSQDKTDPVLGVPMILGSTTTLGKARFCFVSLTRRVGIPILFNSFT